MIPDLDRGIAWTWPFGAVRGNKRRAGFTTNKGKPRNKARARMARESRRRNRG